MDTNKKGKKEKKVKKGVAVSEIDFGNLDTQEVRDLFAEFIAHRTEIKKPMTQRAAKMLVNQWHSKSPKEFTAAIRQSIANGWQGLFPPKDSPEETKTPRCLTPDELKNWTAN